jgi:uncharacterized protein (DUF2235 family)
MKRLALFLDGTWNTLGNNTNVWRLRALCAPDADDQLVYYGQGVGTKFGEQLRGGTMGYGLDHEILDAYSWLVRRFESGDEIFIFGFSRGAYAARSLSGLIAKCGVLVPGAPLSIEQLYARYRRYSDKTINNLLATADAADLSLEERWIVRHCISTNIKFVGVWDTVGSLGTPWTPLGKRVAKYRFFDTHLRLKNEFAFHALALDEQRQAFEPTFWTRTVDNSDTAAPGSGRPLGNVEQRWFPGAHANVGGGYPSDILAQRPLQWIMDKAGAAGLVFRPDFSVEPDDPCAPITDSYAAMTPAAIRWFFPRFDRTVGLDPERGTVRTTARINETIDRSVFERWRSNPAYRPPSLALWAQRKGVDPATFSESRMAIDPTIIIAD